MQIPFFILMFVLGSAFGSFLCCQVRRLHLKTKKGKHAAKLGSRSVCLHCRHRLAWYENIPLFSWIFLQGKCQKCHKKIGLLEFLSELGVATAFLLISIHFANTTNFPSSSPMDWLIFVAALIFTTSLAFLAIYDGMCGQLPVIGLTISVICAIILISLQIGNSFLVAANLLLPIASAALFGGIYLILYIVSKGTWVGDGDWILAGAIGLALGHPWLAMIALFVANFSACLIMYPLVKKQKNHQIYFGPFLVLSFVIVYSFSNFFIS